MLALPTRPAFDDSAIDRAELAPSTRAKYRTAIALLLAAGVSPFDFDALQTYAASLTTSARSHLKSALKIITKGELTRIKGEATPQNVDAIQALVYRVEAMGEAIHVQQDKGTKGHTWLSLDQVERLTARPDKSTLVGRRDWIVLALLVGAGLRREELSNLTFDNIIQQPTKQGTRDVITLKGKGDKSRTIPLSRTLADALKNWKEETGGGRVARSVNGRLGSSLAASNIFEIVRLYGEFIGVPNLAPHDLRRSYARIGYDAGVPVEQISKLLGHADIKTTMRYLGIEIDIESSVSDFVPLK